MTTVQRRRVIGAGLDRVDGPLKVSGRGALPVRRQLPRHGLRGVRPQHDRGRPDPGHRCSRRAEALPGVHECITHRNAPRLGRAAPSVLGPQPPPPLQDDRVLHHGQYVAVVVADTPRAGRRRGTPRASSPTNPASRCSRSDDARADTSCTTRRGRHAARRRRRGAGDRRRDRATPTTPPPDNTNNPLGLFATVAAWDGDRLTVHDATQCTVQRPHRRSPGRSASRSPRCGCTCPYLGGGFGAGLRAWPHVVLAALAARVAGRRSSWS